jgi:CheY-like chemotaxis protein
MDGFMIRETMLQSSILKNIPFIILSHKKDEETVQRALSLEIVHYLKKPYMLSELIGIVRKSLPQGSP